MQKTIEGINLQGEKRKYTINLMDAEQGGRIYYTHLMGLFGTMIEMGLFSVTALGTMLPRCISWAGIKDMAQSMLAAANIEAASGDEILHYVADMAGNCPLFEKDRRELICALYYAVRANFEKETDFLTVEGEEESDDGDTSPEGEETESVVAKSSTP